MNKVEVSQPSHSKHDRHFVIMQPSKLIILNVLLLPLSYYLGHESAMLSSLQSESLETLVAWQQDQVRPTLNASLEEMASNVTANCEPAGALPDVNGLDIDQCRGLFQAQVCSKSFTLTNFQDLFKYALNEL